MEPSSAVAVRGDASPPQVPIIALAGEWEEVFQGEAKAALETLLPGYLQQWRWFGGKARQIRSTVLAEAVRFPYDSSVAYWVFLAVAYGEGEPETYVLPLTIAVGPRAEEVQQESPQAVIARVRRTDAEGLLCEAWWEPPLWEAVLAAIARGQHVPGDGGGAVRPAHPGVRRPPGPGRCPPGPHPSGSRAEQHLGRLRGSADPQALSARR